MRRSVVLLGSALTIALAAPLVGQEPASTPPAMETGQGVEPAAGAPAPSDPVAGPSETATRPGGLPAREPPPRTLRAYWHVFAAFAVVWALLFGYALSIGRRFARVEDEVRRLSQTPP